MRKSVAREYYEAILVAFILALFVRTFVFVNFKIPSGSMEDNLLIGDHLVVNKFIYAGNADSFLHHLFPYRAPERGDVVVFKYPEDTRRDFIKRCVALAGDVVEIKEKSRDLGIVLEAAQSPERDIPDYVDVDYKKMTASISRIPVLADVPYPVQMEPNLVVEFYSR